MPFRPALPTLVLASALSLAAAPGSVVAKGSQARGGPGKDAVLKADPVQVPSPGRIAEVTGAPSGFWIEDTNGRTVKSFEVAQQAVGFQLAPGRYRVLPNLKADTPKVSVTVTIRWE